MCGIAGFMGRGSAEDLQAMGSSLAHRGPDASGTWLAPDGTAGLAHTRLAIIDLSPAGAQPMQDESGRYVISFNGEIYNFAELKKELASYPFKSHSDTEVILAAYREFGAEAFKKMRGMFALAIYDLHKKELVLARDRLGEKPLYWSFHNSLFLFGSELKALRTHADCPHKLDLRSLVHYLGREYVPTPRTMYEGIHKLEPGSLLRFKNAAVSIETFWSPCTEPQRISEAEAQERLHELLSKAVGERLVSDVPLGVFLSGGIDSSTVAWYAARVSPNIETFSIGFSEKTFDESTQAQLVAKHLGTKHHERILSASDALALLKDLPQVLDEPIADASILPTLLLSKFTREHVTVGLGGDGADELLLGYPTFKAEEYARLYARMPHALRALLRSGIEVLPTGNGYLSFDFKARKFTHDFADDPALRHLQWLGSFREDQFSALLTSEVAQQAQGITAELAAQWHAECPSLSGLNALSHLYMRTYLMDQVLVKVDRASMHHGLEVRAPFLSHDLVEFLLALPPEFKYQSGRGKHLLRSLMRGKLPSEILNRPKQGFAAPVAQWLRGELCELMTEILSRADPSLFNRPYIEQLMREHIAGSHNHAKKLWTLLVFHLWYDTWQVR